MTVTWILIIGSVWAITNYQTREECLAAAKEVRMQYITQCIPTTYGSVIGQSK